MTTTPIAAGPLDVTVRAQFEHWMSDEGQSPKAVERSRDGEYKYMPAGAAWKAWQAAAKAEREACAEVCDEYMNWCKSWGLYENDNIANEGAKECAAAIRARSNANVCGLPHGKEDK